MPAASGDRLSEAGAAAQLHLPAQRRPRDHDQPDRQRRGPPAPQSRGAARSRRTSRNDRHRRRGIPAAWKARTSSATAAPPMDTSIGGVAMPAGTYVHLCIGAANRDPDPVPRSRPLRHPPPSQPPPGVRLRHPHLRRQFAGADGGRRWRSASWCRRFKTIERAGARVRSPRPRRAAGPVPRPICALSRRHRARLHKAR